MPTQIRTLLQDEMEHEKIRYLLNLNSARNVMIDAGVVCAHSHIIEDFVMGVLLVLFNISIQETA